VGDRCVGVQTPEAAFLGRVTLMATGGAGALWGSTTNAPGATGDGIALALEAGAQVADLEFMQFHPTVLTDGRPQSVLLTEALRGAGARLINERGERFVEELGPRHVVAKAILGQGAVFLDCRDIPGLEERFPTVIEGARGRGLDPVTEILPVSPAAHYFVGGVAADAYGRTSMPGLAAAGECASTGMHGANRMAGNSLLEAVVVGRRVGAVIMDEPVPEHGARVSFAAVEDIDPRIPAIMWAGAGPIRDEDGLRAAGQALSTLPQSPHRSLCLAVVRAARARAESRGVHIRSDYPEPEPAFAVRSFDRAPRAVAD
ncbi:MAG: FAD-binding protein, partial [Actinomycetota bacterium]